MLAADVEDEQQALKLKETKLFSNKISTPVSLISFEVAKD
jgi:hypothetical protein